MKVPFFEQLIRVVAGDIDDLGHVNNTVYLTYAEACSRAHSDSLGLTIAVLKEAGAVPVVRRHEVHYHRPAHLGDLLRVSTRITQVRGARALRHNQVHHASTGHLLVDILTEWVWLEPRSLKPTRIPKRVAAAFGLERPVPTAPLSRSASGTTNGSR